MNDYVVDNGVVLTGTDDGSIRWHPGISQRRASEALREYFQVERDEELGRLRDPEYPHFVWYPLDNEPDRVRVVDENKGEMYEWSRAGLSELSVGVAAMESYQSSRRYCELHTETKPEPWELAKPGEIWVLTSYGDSAVFRCGSVGLYALGSGTPLDQMLIKNAITEAKRIWPEED